MFTLAQTSEQTDLADALRQLGQRTIRPAMAHGGNPSQTDLAGVWRDLHGMGLASPVRAEHGGEGIPDAATSVLIAEEIAFGDPGVGYDLVCRSHAATLIDTLGSAAQRESYLPRLLGDPGFGAGIAYFEGYGRSPLELGTVARRSADGWALTGRKIGVTRPAVADVQVVLAADALTGDLAAFAVEPATVSGFSVARDDRETGKLGLDAALTGNIELDSVLVPASARLPGSETDPLALHRAVAATRLGVGAVLLGTARAALAYATDYANTRVAFGQPIAQYQGVTFPLVEVDMELDASRLLVWRAAVELASGTGPEASGPEASDPEASDPGAIARRTAEAVARCQRTALEAGRIGINTLGGHGFIADHPLEQWYRAAGTLAALDFDPLESDCVAL